MIKKSQVSMWVIVGIMIVASFILIILLWRHYTTTDVNINECSTDDDCIKKQVTCCPCDKGGQERCIPKDKEEYYNVLLADCPVNLSTICPVDDHCNANVCRCINNRCG
jgi:hypothetical protein